MDYTGLLAAGVGARYLVQTAPVRAYTAVIPLLLSGCITVDDKGMEDFWQGALTGGSFEAGVRHSVGKSEASDDKKGGQSMAERAVAGERGAQLRPGENGADFAERFSDNK